MLESNDEVTALAGKLKQAERAGIQAEKNVAAAKTVLEDKISTLLDRRAETEALSVAGAHSLTPSAASLTNAGVVFLISLCAVSTEVCSIWWERRRPRAAAACIRFWR